MGQIKYPKEAKITKDLIFAEFVVQKDGSVGDIKILKKADDAFADEVVRVLKSSPKWTPGQQRGIPIPVQYTIPIVFNVQ